MVLLRQLVEHDILKKLKKIVGKQEPYSVKIYSKEEKDKLTELTNKSLTNEQKSRLKEARDVARKASKSSKSKYGPSKNEQEAYRSLYKEREKVVNEVLGKYRSKQLNTFSLDDTTYGKEIVNHIDWNSIEEIKPVIKRNKE